jgi:hypothetical protein
MNKMYLFQLINLESLPNNQYIALYILLVYFLFYFNPHTCEFGFATKRPNIIGVKPNKFMKLRLLTQS